MFDTVCECDPTRSYCVIDFLFGFQQIEVFPHFFFICTFHWKNQFSYTKKSGIKMRKMSSMKMILPFHEF